MKWLVAAIILCIIVPDAQNAMFNPPEHDNDKAASTVDWCYHKPSCSYHTWPTIAPQYCNGSRQSPINISTANAIGDASLIAFNFYNFSSTMALKKIENTGRTVKVTLANGIGISGGGLPERYDSLQFHFHWGNGSSVPGSEHTVDGKRYPMELHIVNIKASHNGNTTTAVNDSTGLAALGFFIEEMPGNATGQPEAWKNFTHYLSNITKKGDYVSPASGLSLDSLLHGVDRTKYYRYLGSLTTPNCNEAVVWTVFKEPIKVSKDLIDLFSNTLHIYNTTSSPLMTGVYRGIQPPQNVTTQVSDTTSGCAKPCFSVGLITLFLLALGRSC